MEALNQLKITDLPEWATDGERRRARRLVTRLLAEGCRITVCHCEGVELRLSNNKADILAAMSLTGLDNLHCYLPKEGAPGKWQRVGTIALVYGNARDGSELVCDHTDNEFCDAVTGGL